MRFRFWIFPIFCLLMVGVLYLPAFSFSSLNGNDIIASDMDVVYLSDFVENGYRFGDFMFKPVIDDDRITIDAFSMGGRSHRIYDVRMSSGGGNVVLFDKDSGYKELFIKDDIGLNALFGNYSSWSVPGSAISASREKYIVEFEDEPVYVMMSNLMSKLDSNADDELNGIGVVIGNNGNLSGYTSLSAAVSAHEKRIASVHQAAKADIKTIARSHASGAVVMREYSRVFNGMAIVVEDDDALDVLDEIRGLPYVRGVFEDTEVHAVLDDSVSFINATDVWMMNNTGMNVTGSNVTIAIIDTGVDYTHPDLGGANISTFYNGTLYEHLVESDHPYDNYEDVNFTITMDGFEKIAVHFENISIERYYDYIYLYDGSNNLVKSYTGVYNDVWSPSVSGDTIKVRLVTDFSVVSYGFFIDEVIDGEAVEVVSDENATSKVVGGWDFYNNDADFMDDHGHGTHVAATACGNGTLMGVAPDANILAYKVLSAYGGGSSSDIIAAIEMAVEEGADVISMSLGGDGNPDDALSRAVDNAFDAGVVVVVAAGNSGPSYGTVASPGTARNALTVGATDKAGVIASFSSKGPVVWANGSIVKPDVLAPGVSICAARAAGTTTGSTCVDSYHVSLSGTSMATPHVAGLAALLIQAHPDWSPADVKSAIMTGAVDLGYDVVSQGSGLVNAIDSYNESLIVSYSNLSFDFSSGAQMLFENVTVRNIFNGSIGVNISVGSAYTTGGSVYDAGHVNVSYMNVSLGSNESFEFSANVSDVSGLMFGKIVLAYRGRNHTLPYILSSMSYLNVSVGSGGLPRGLGSVYPYVYVYDDALDYTGYLSSGYFTDGWENLDVPAGRNYTVCALGQFNTSVDYILMDWVSVGSSGVDLQMDITDARPFSVQGVGVDGRDIYMYLWEFGFVSYIGTSVYPVELTLSDYSAQGNRTVYISNKPVYGPDTDIVLKYSGIPVV